MAYQLAQSAKKGLLVLGLLSALPAFGWDWSYVKPGVGVDVGFVKQPFETSYGEEHFRETFPYSNAFLSLRLHRYFGVEAGYFRDYRGQKQQFYPTQAPVLGFVNPLQDEKFTISETFARGWNLGLTGFVPLCPKWKTELIGFAGISRVERDYYTSLIEQANPANPIATWDSDTETLARLGIGIKQPITPHFSLRLMVLWEDGDSLDATFPTPVGQGGPSFPSKPSDYYHVKPKDNYIVSLGFNLEFDFFA